MPLQAAIHRAATGRPRRIAADIGGSGAQMPSASDFHSSGTTTSVLLTCLRIRDDKQNNSLIFNSKVTNRNASWRYKIQSRKSHRQEASSTVRQHHHLPIQNLQRVSQVSFESLGTARTVPFQGLLGQPVSSTARSTRTC